MNKLVSSLFRFKGQAHHALKANSPAILAALGVSGTVTTAYLAGKASYEAAKVINGEDVPPFHGNRKEEFKRDVALVWKLYIPAGVSGVVTIGCIIAATRVGMRRTAAVTAAYSLSEKAFSEYRDKVTETIGKRKEKDIRDGIAQDRVKNSPPSDRELLIAGPGNVLCCELFTGRYFHSDMESLRRAQNDINAKLLREMYCSLSDFYYLVGLPYTSHSSDVGWNSDKLLELSYSTVMAQDGRPCLAIEYNYTKPL